MMFVAVLLFFVLTDGQGQERSGWAGYEEHAGLRGWLKFHATPAAWRAAAAACLGEDAQLASPWSRAFTAAVSSLQARHGAPVTHSGLRATLPFLSGELPQSLDGSELVRCGVFLANGSTAEMACDRRLPYVCFAPKPAADSRAWPGYEYEAELRGFLKLHTRAADWLAARATCHLEGAFLASPWSQQFSSAIQRLQMSRPEEAAGAVFAGVHEISSFTDGAYKYVQGEPVLSLSRSDLIRGERCGVLFANGTEGATACERRLPFVCYAPEPPAPSTDPAPSTHTTTSTPVPTAASTTIPRTTASTFPTADPTIPPTTSTSPPTTSTIPPTTSTIPPTTSTSPPTTSTIPPTTPTIPPTTPTTTTAPSTAPTSPTTVSTTTTTVEVVRTVATTVPAPTSSKASTSEPKTSPTQTPAPSSAICRDMGLDTGYEWTEVTGACYKFHATGATWSAANATCGREGARLAVPGSDEEARFFREMLLSHLKTGITGASFKGAVAVGIYYEDGVWMTVDGISLEDSGYSKWWPGWPLAEKVARWGFMEHTGRLENYSASITTPFICEAAPPVAVR